MDNVLFAVLSTLMELLPVTGVLVRCSLVTDLETWDYIKDLLALDVAQAVALLVELILLSDDAVVLLYLKKVVVKFLLVDSVKVELGVGICFKKCTGTASSDRKSVV